MSELLASLPFDDRMKFVARWTSSQEMAYQLAWAIMRGECCRERLDAICELIFRRGHRVPVKTMTALILGAPKEDGMYIELGESIGDCAQFMTDEQLIRTVRAMYRRTFIQNVDPYKLTWNKFLDEFHEALDVDGRSSRRDHLFITRDWTMEGIILTTRMNIIMTKAERLWDYGTPEEGSAEWERLMAPPGPAEVLAHAAAYKAALAKAPAMADLSVEELGAYLAKGDHCGICLTAALSQVDVVRLSEAEAEADTWRVQAMWKEEILDRTWNS